MTGILGEETVFSTPWFALRALRVAGSAEPHYALAAPDYVTVLALTPAREVLLVEQFRPAVGRVTLELPSGNVDAGETPIIAAARELREETGYDAGTLIPLGGLLPDSGRLANRAWGFFAPGAVPVGATPELTVVPMALPAFFDAMRQGRLDHAVHIALAGLAMLHGHLALP